MRRYIAWVFIIMLLALGLAIASFTISLGSQPEMGRWVAEALQKKSVAIEKNAPKLVILSGSNAHLGFSARRLSELYKIESVNAAVNAGLGLKYILYFARPYIAPGRVFIMPLEYELYGQSNTSSALIYQVVGFDKNYFQQFNLFDKAKFVLEISWKDRFRLFEQLGAPLSMKKTDGYQSTTINDWGDETANTIAARTPAMLAGATAQKPRMYTVNDAAWREIELFVRDVHEAGGKVVLAFPNIYMGALDTQLNQLFFKEIAKRASELDILVLGSPEAAAFDITRAFDTYYHQDIIGQTLSTDRLYSNLRQAGIF